MKNKAKQRYTARKWKTYCKIFFQLRHVWLHNIGKPNEEARFKAMTLAFELNRR